MSEWQIKILIDGECPLCKREAGFLRRLDGGRQRLLIEDITTPDFDPCKYDTKMDDLMGQIHGVMPNGTLVKGVEVFRLAYEAVGLGWLLAPTKWPILKQLSDTCYTWFARNRLRLTGRARACNSTRCRVDRS
ncbi:MAG: thiol-disulfide oxidoreductase DCC family protein [Planctomycetota bacterium]